MCKVPEQIMLPKVKYSQTKVHVVLQIYFSKHVAVVMK